MHRLQFLARGVQVYIKQLRLALEGKIGDTLKTPEVCVMCIACNVPASHATSVNT